MAKAKFVYRGRERTVESVVRKSRQSGGSFESYLPADVQMYKAKEGECTVRILPPTWEDTEKWGDGWDVGVQLHYNVGPDNAAYLCLDKMKGEPCPVCEARRKATDEDEADQLKASFRSLCWVIDRDNEKAGPMVWSLPITLFRDINARSVDKKTNTPILIDDPEEGYDIIFNRTGTGLKTKYEAVEVSREPSPLHDDEKLQNRWLEYIAEHSLPDMLVFYDADHIEKVLYGKAPKVAEEEVEEETTAPRSRRSVVDEEEEEAEVPTRASRRAAAVEEEPEPRPSSRRRLLKEGEEDEIPFEEEAVPRSRRAAPAEEAPETDEEGEGDAGPVARARSRLERLKQRQRV